MGNKQSGNKQFPPNLEQPEFVLKMRNKEILPKPANNINNNTQNLEQPEFVLTVSPNDTSEAKEYYGSPNESLMDVNNVFNEKFQELNKQLIPLFDEKKPTNFIVKIYQKAKEKVNDTIFYNNKKANSVREVNFDAFKIGIKSAAEITNEHVTITLGIISTTALAIAPPIGLLIAASSMLILKTLHTIRSNHELFDIMNDLLSLLKVITEEFKITNENNVPHMVILKTHIIKIFSLMSSINGIYNWRKMVIFPNSVINSFVKEIALINTALIVDLKIDLINLSKNYDKEIKQSDGVVPIANINNDNEVKNEVTEINVDNVDAQLKKNEDEKVDDILDAVVNPNVNIDNPDLNKNIIDLVVKTNAVAEDPQIRAGYLTYLKQEQKEQDIMPKQGGSKLKKNVQHKFRRTKNLKKHKNKTSKSKNIKKRKN